MQKLLEKLVEKNRSWTSKGKCASYIPELANVDSSILGISVMDLDKKVYVITRSHQDDMQDNSNCKLMYAKGGYKFYTR